MSKEEAADQLLFILNHGFEGNLDRLSRDPAGNADDGLNADRERAGTAVLANGERVEIHLARVTPPTGPAIWLVAADTVGDIPRMYEHAGLPQIERRLPKFLTAASVGELQLWVPLALLLLVPILYAVSKLLLWTLVELYLLAFKLRGLSVPLRRSRGWKALSRPKIFIAGTDDGIADALGKEVTGELVQAAPVYFQGSLTLGNNPSTTVGDPGDVQIGDTVRVQGQGLISPFVSQIVGKAPSGPNYVLTFADVYTTGPSGSYTMERVARWTLNFVDSLRCALPDARWGHRAWAH